VLQKKFTKVQVTKPKKVNLVCKLDKVELPANEKKLSKGYAFAFYKDGKSASDAAKANNGKALDKKHKFKTDVLAEIAKYRKVPDQWPEPPKLELKERPFFQDWLMDAKVRDQFVIRFGNETQVYWNDPYEHADQAGRVLCYGGEREKKAGKFWTSSLVKWSPKGSYLATFHLQGICLWGGKEFRRVGRFEHSKVTEVDFSPNERYLVTGNAGGGSRPETIRVWDVDSQQMLRSFECSGNDRWPVFKWSSDDKYVCRALQDKISVYEVPSMGLLDKKSISQKSVQAASFSPSNPYIATWKPESNSIPASLHIIEIPSKKVVRERHFYRVIDLKLHWHPQGDFLCAELSRLKSKKTVVYSFEIFRMTSKNIPVEVMEMKENEPVVDFAWEPNGDCFAVVHGDKKSGRNDVSIYTLKGTKLKLLKKIEARMCNKLYWSPRGRTLILAGLGQLNGHLEFFDANTLTALTTVEHFMCTYIEWDPSGRFVITAVTQRIQGGELRYAMENGYKLWTSWGELLADSQQSSFYQILWRPRPSCLLSEEQKKKVTKELRSKWWRKFEEADHKLKVANLGEQQRLKHEAAENWAKYRSSRRKERDDPANVKAREEILGEKENDKERFVVVETLVEKVLSREEEEVVEDTCIVVPSNS